MPSNNFFHCQIPQETFWGIYQKKKNKYQKTVHKTVDKHQIRLLTIKIKYTMNPQKKWTKKVIQNQPTFYNTHYKQLPTTNYCSTKTK